MIDFASYKPQQVFLVQGTSRTYEEIIAELETRAPIVHGMSVPRLTMDYARTVASFALEGDGTERYLVVYFAVFSPDAAQVLLKSLEEPDMDTTIIFITPYPYVVPRTIRSRVTLMSVPVHTKDSPTRTRAQALAYIKEELSGESDDDAATRRAKAIAFLDELEIQTRGTAEKSRTLYEAKHMLLVANLPTKHIAEYVVATVF